MRSLDFYFFLLIETNVNKPIKKTHSVNSEIFMSIIQVMSLPTIDTRSIVGKDITWMILIKTLQKRLGIIGYLLDIIGCQ